MNYHSQRTKKHLEKINKIKNFLITLFWASVPVAVVSVIILEFTQVLSLTNGGM